MADNQSDEAMGEMNVDDPNVERCREWLMNFYRDYCAHHGISPGEGIVGALAFIAELASFSPGCRKEWFKKITHKSVDEMANRYFDPRDKPKSRVSDITQN